MYSYVLGAALREDHLREFLDNWSLDSDPVLRWQVQRDLLGAPDDVWQATRARVATERAAKMHV